MRKTFPYGLLVENLPVHINEGDIRGMFEKYSRHIVKINLEGPTLSQKYAFVEFNSFKEAHDAESDLNDFQIGSQRVKVTLVETLTTRDLHGIPPKFRVEVRGLPSKVSWKELTAHMESAGPIIFAEVFRDSEGKFGLVDYVKSESMENAIHTLDNSEFRNSHGTTHIHVTKYEGRKIIDPNKSTNTREGIFPS